MKALPANPECRGDLREPEERYADYESRQDLQRWAGDFAAAEDTITAWVAAAPHDFGAHQRRGEVAYLAGDYASAIDHLTTAWELFLPQAAAGGQFASYDTLTVTVWDVVQPPVLLPLQLAAAVVLP